MGLIETVLATFGRIDRVHTEPVELEEPFVDVAARFAALPGTVALLSGGDLDAAQYHILAVDPWMTVKSYGAELQAGLAGTTHRETGDPFALLKGLVQAFQMEGDGLAGPVAAGLFGYLGYDLKDFVETLPRTSVDDLGLPQCCLYAPSAVLVQDKRTGEGHLCIPVPEKAETDRWRDTRSAFYQRLQDAETGRGVFRGKTTGFRSAFTRETYKAAVEKIKAYIVSGHIYQVNLSQRFEAGFSGDPFALFQALYEAAPAPFYAYVNAGDHQIVSTSPERFLQQQGRRVETRPIKGTRPRGTNPAEDQALAEALVRSGKDDAELSMIVDLMRNDLGRVCAGGSVKVTEHKRLEPYRNVFHLVSVIEGRLSEHTDSIDLIRAAFPGGSITGCPRIRAMEIIDELEPCRRHIYTGSIGYIGFHDVLDLSIAIRTATIVGDRMYFSVGGGVVFDSDPSDEYEETLHKGRTVMGAFEQVAEVPDGKGHVWYNGLVVPAGDARLPITSAGVEYGWGLFETLRVDQGVPALLDEHLDRFNHSWRTLFGTAAPDLTWQAVIEQVITANRLETGVARVKILAIRGEGGRPSLAVTAAAYVHRLERLKKTGLDLATYPHPRQTPLADHKSTNYLYCALANQWAQDHGADEAAIVNPDGSLSETATANLLFINGRQVIRPASDHVLPGVMERQALRVLRREGYTVCRRKVMPSELPEFDGVLMTNSLIGAVAVLHLDGIRMGDPIPLCNRLNRVLL